jgi:hypothetical protein
MSLEGREIDDPRRMRRELLSVGCDVCYDVGIYHPDLRGR